MDTDPVLLSELRRGVSASAGIRLKGADLIIRELRLWVFLASGDGAVSDGVF